MLQPVMPLVYEVVNPAIKQTTVADLLLDVFGLIGGIILIALLAGALAAWFLVGFRTLWPQNSFNGAASESTRLDLSG